jgi:hypothetical protein
MRIRELTASQCTEILRRSELGHLACSRHDQPYIVPIHFSYDPTGECLYAFSGVGQKIQWMRDNPRVCVEVEDITDKNNWTTVLVYGDYQELSDGPEDAAARKHALELFRSRPEWWYPAAGRTDRREHHALVIYRIRINRTSGRSAARARV